MISLDSIQHGATNLPPRVVIYGPHKIGKSTLAASAPNPIFIQTEEGLDALDVAKFPLAKSFDDVLAAISALFSEPHDYNTVVLDSLDWLEPLVWQYTSKLHGKENIEAFGYGKGYVHASDTWRMFLDGLDALRRHRGMAVICLAHHQIRRFDAPDQEPFDRYLLKLHERAGSMVQEWADVIGFANHESVTTKADVGRDQKVTRAIGTGRRLLHLSETPAFQAGNRYRMPASVELSWPAFLAAFPQPAAAANDVQSAPAAQQQAA